MTPGLVLLIIYGITVVVCGVLHWAEYIDDKRNGYNKSLKEKVIHLYLIPLIPVINIFAIIYSIVEHVS